MVRFENECHLTNDDGTPDKVFPAGSTTLESNLPKRWLANAVERGAATIIHDAPVPQPEAEAAPEPPADQLE